MPHSAKLPLWVRAFSAGLAYRGVLPLFLLMLYAWLRVKLLNFLLQNNPRYIFNFEMYVTRPLQYYLGRGGCFCFLPWPHSWHCTGRFTA